MKQDEFTVQKNMVVSLEYVLTLDDGEEIDRAESGEPLIYLQGHQNIIPGLEDALVGLRVGESKDVVVAPADGYGEYDPDNFESMPLDAFPSDLELEEGLGLELRDGKSGQIYQVTIAEILDDEVVLDFNHPLAGETLHFAVMVADLRQATAEELAHGHVHTHGHHH